MEDGRFDALASFTFDLGTGALERSTIRRWIWADGSKLKGLVRRREAEAAFYGG